MCEHTGRESRPWRRCPRASHRSWVLSRVSNLSVITLLAVIDQVVWKLRNLEASPPSPPSPPRPPAMQQLPPALEAAPIPPWKKGAVKRWISGAIKPKQSSGRSEAEESSDGKEEQSSGSKGRSVEAVKRKRKKNKSKSKKRKEDERDLSPSMQRLLASSPTPPGSPVPVSRTGRRDPGPN